MRHIEDKAREWMQRNPNVMDRFISFARKAKAQGVKRLGIALLVERVRWYGIVDSPDEDFKISNTHRAYIAREIMERCPDLDGFFKLSELRSVDFNSIARLP